jgi:hypothetical protein
VTRVSVHGRVYNGAAIRVHEQQLGVDALPGMDADIA